MKGKVAYSIMNTPYNLTMKYSIVFSIPVHEKFEVIVDQIININHFNPNCAIVLHLSKKFDYTGTAMSEEQFRQIVNSFENVFINENRLDTVYFNIGTYPCFKF